MFEHALKASPANRWRLAGRLSILPAAVERGEAPAAQQQEQQQQAPAAQQPAAQPEVRVGHIAEAQRQEAEPAWVRPKRQAAAARGRR